MTRNRKVDPEVLEREYIYDAGEPPISYRALAEKHGVVLETVAKRGREGDWFRRREEYRRDHIGSVGLPVNGQSLRLETALREPAAAIGVEYLKKYAKALADGEIKINTRDMLGVVAMMRQLALDAAVDKPTEEVLLDPDAPFDHDFAKRVLAQLEAGSLNGHDDAEPRGPGAPAEAPPAGAEEPREN